MFAADVGQLLQVEVVGQKMAKRFYPASPETRLIPAGPGTGIC